MPCQDYPSDKWSDPTDSEAYKRLKARADMLARIACKAMTELEANEIAEMLLLRDDEVRTWWQQHKINDAKAAKRKRNDNVIWED